MAETCVHFPIALLLKPGWHTHYLKLFESLQKPPTGEWKVLVVISVLVQPEQDPVNIQLLLKETRKVALSQ